MVAAYGAAALEHPLTDLERYQLALNLQHVEDRAAAAAMRGLAAALTDAPLDPALADALADTPEEAAELLFRANVARREARRRREGGP